MWSKARNQLPLISVRNHEPDSSFARPCEGPGIFTSAMSLLANQRVYLCTKFTGHWPVGVAAVVFAETPKQAADILNGELEANHGLKGDATPEMMEWVNPVGRTCYVLCDGNY